MRTEVLYHLCELEDEVLLVFFLFDEGINFLREEMDVRDFKFFSENGKDFKSFLTRLLLVNLFGRRKELLVVIAIFLFTSGCELSILGFLLPKLSVLGGGYCSNALCF